MQLVLSGNVGGQVQRRATLAKACDVVVFAFDRHQRDATDLLQVNQFAPMRHGTFGQAMLDEHVLDGLQIEFSRQIHHREVFVIEFAMLFGAVAITADEMAEQVLVRLDMPIQIHGHESSQLQKTWIDPSPKATVGPRYCRDDIALEPFRAVLLRQAIDSRRADPRIDRATRQHQRQRHVRIAGFFHQRHGRQDRHRGLANREDMHIATEVVEDVAHGIDVVIKIERAGRRRHIARVLPIGNVDVVIGKKRFDRAAQ